MASIDGMALNSPDGSTTAGAAFILQSPPEYPESGALQDSKFELQPTSRYMVVRFAHSKDAREAYRKGIALAQEVLDRLSIHGRGDFFLKEPDTEHLVWWTDE